MRYLLFLLLSATFYGCALPAGWEEIDTKGLPERAMLSSVMVDSDSVFYAASFVPYITIYISTNSGKDWKEFATTQSEGLASQMFAFNKVLILKSKFSLSSDDAWLAFNFSSFMILDTRF